MNWTEDARRLFTMALFVVGLVGLVPPQPVKASPVMSRWLAKYYFSDDTFSSQVGERSQMCTSFVSWGSTSQYVMYNGGDCEAGGSDGHTCCWDGDGSGGCGGLQDMEMPCW